MNIKNILLFMLLAVFLFPAAAQTSSTSSSSSQSTDLGLPATQFNMEGFPQWSKELRRAEIIAFGTFPFTMFIAITIMDSWRFYSHGWDMRYAPWPLKGAGAVDMSADDHKRVMLYAALGSFALAFTDFVIVQIKRNNTRQREKFLPPGTPIIVRTPLDTANGDAEDAPLPGP
ncbi:MAG: hypothetical protein LBK08_06525 [Treponema sp.]|jgi:hypothetical protein|nr:hypothetical protein [Treponema sp.]